MRNRIKCYKKENDGYFRLVFECFADESKAEIKAKKLLEEFDKVSIQDYKGRYGEMIYQRGQEPMYFDYDFYDAYNGIFGY